MPDADAATEELPARLVLHGHVRVGLPVERALYLFTPAGERLWVDGWAPSFPAGEHGDGGHAGTVFLTRRHGEETIWAVVERADRIVRYARVTPGEWAGLVEVRCSPDVDGGTIAEVTYDLTALGDVGRARLRELADGYEVYLAEWERLIATAIAAGRLDVPVPGSPT